MGVSGVRGGARSEILRGGKKVFSLLMLFFVFVVIVCVFDFWLGFSCGCGCGCYRTFGGMPETATICPSETLTLITSFRCVT